MTDFNTDLKTGNTWMWFVGIGLLLILGGILALANPLAASIAVEQLVGIVMLVCGAVQLWAVFRDQGQDGRLWNGFTALLGIIAGVFLLANPLQGMVSLTLIVGILFLIGGVVRLLLAFRNKQGNLFWILLLSGVVSAIVGIMVLGNIAAAATALLGIMLGIELLSDGIGLMALGFLARSAKG